MEAAFPERLRFDRFSEQTDRWRGRKRRCSAVRSSCWRWRCRRLTGRRTNRSPWVPPSWTTWTHASAWPGEWIMTSTHRGRGPRLRAVWCHLNLGTTMAVLGLLACYYCVNTKLITIDNILARTVAAFFLQFVFVSLLLIGPELKFLYQFKFHHPVLVLYLPTSAT